MHQVLSYLLHYALNNWQTILTYLAGGTLVSAVAEVWIRFRKHDKALWKELTVGTISGLGTLSDWIINNYATSPLSTLGNVGPRIFLAAVFMHRLLINPLFKQVPKLFTNNPVSNIWKDAAAYRAEQAANKPADPNGSFL